MELSLTGKTALVTGASRGIGKAIAMELLAQGAYIIGTATQEMGVAVINEFTSGHGHGLMWTAGEQVSTESLIASLKDTPLDIVVNNAGITRDNLLLRMKDDEWNDVIQTNLSSVFYLTRYAIKHMMKQRWGRVINITSISGLLGNPGQSNYAAAKAGLIGFTKALALEVASRGITVNAVAPGFIETDMAKQYSDNTEYTNKIPMGAMGKPEDIAAAVAFLASPSARYITGDVLKVSGGL